MILPQLYRFEPELTVEQKLYKQSFQRGDSTKFAVKEEYFWWKISCVSQADIKLQIKLKK